MGNIVLLYFACRNHKPGLLSSFMTYPRIFKMNNTTWTISEEDKTRLFHCWDPISRFNTATYVWPSQAKT
jgi:hypothetical protein